LRDALAAENRPELMTRPTRSKPTKS